MTTQRSLFDLAEGQRRRDEGLTLVSTGRDGWLLRARALAYNHCRNYGEVSSDDLRELGLETPANTSENIWGAIFRDQRFVLVRFVSSRRPERHANRIGVWRLVAQDTKEKASVMGRQPLVAGALDRRQPGEA